ncbi:MAG TPA: 50S ribosomal protein L24 [Candidatus Paceibacterota bacterium]|nr:50S ribosomal protein L24 [Candidatus Paceibacterota bacterium]HPT18283.1 50S ribosomal protein L24 [Candidatus Paceibacterota bacterium]
MKLRKGDNVIVTAGKDKGKKGKIVKALPSLNKVVVEGLNMTKRHQRPRKSNEKGQIVKMSMPIHVSNVMIVDPKTGSGSRIGKRKIGDKMARISKKSNQEI